MKKKYIIYFGFLMIVSACSSIKQVVMENNVKKFINHSSILSQHITGLSIYDINAQEFLLDYHSTRKFTPASNTKLLTLYAALTSLGDSIPFLLYKKSGSVCMVTPTGDPTFLDERFPTQKGLDFLKDCTSISIHWPNHISLRHYGKGWAWDDYFYDYQPERAWWPVYSNQVKIVQSKDKVMVTPSFFDNYVEMIDRDRSGIEVDRAINYNLFKVYTGKDTSGFERSIPFVYSKEVLKNILEDTLKSSISFEDSYLVRADTIYSQKTDDVLRWMMKASDNFLAEQLLLQSAWMIGLNEVEPFIHFMKTHRLTDLNEMVWVDGSGLSRYNLIAPVDIVCILLKLYNEFGWERLSTILATGGEGTLKGRYLADIPYIYAKTGTLSNNHNLSGFLFTDSGKILAFSFMNNHYTVPSVQVKDEMEILLNKIKTSY